MEIRASLGTAALLGLKQIRQVDAPTTAYLLQSGSCAGDCAFCPQGRSAKRGKDWLSRVSWPSYPLEELFPAEDNFALPSGLRRLCFQTINAPGSCEELIDVVSVIKERAYLNQLPISASLRPRNLTELSRVFGAGLERVSIPLDTATPELYSSLKGGSFTRALRFIQDAAEGFPGRVGTHLIIGLGETEEEAAHLLLLLGEAKIQVALFAFTPVPGTRLAQAQPPNLGQYRRLQALRYLIQRGVSVELNFGECGQIVDFGLAREDLQTLLADGEAFRTSGCPGCNRPYYNERPGQVPFNYPRPLTGTESAEALARLWVE